MNAPAGDEKMQMNSLARLSSNYFFNFSDSDRDITYTGLKDNVNSFFRGSCGRMGGAGARIMRLLPRTVGETHDISLERVSRCQGHWVSTSLGLVDLVHRYGTILLWTIPFKVFLALAKGCGQGHGTVKRNGRRRGVFLLSRDTFLLAATGIEP